MRLPSIQVALAFALGANRVLAGSSIPSLLSTRKPLDVWVPAVTYPTTGTVLHSNDSMTITWDASNPPAHISNKAMLLLRQGEHTSPFIIAKGFDLRAGQLDIIVPYVLTGANYSFVLFGDSGNYSGACSICSDIGTTYGTECDEDEF
ncbi:hypothetical protein C8F01DRAFT_1150730 [Mycena amicta]|nr:hypothetical protein C8F01DRAFT_1150730 [Mycena amicta]